MAQNPIAGLIPRGSLGLKLLLVCLLVLIMGVPLLFVGALVGDRQTRAAQVTAQIGELSGGQQIVGGPMLLVPYHPPYAGGRVEAQGYTRIKDVVSYDYDVQNAAPTIGRKLIERGGLAGRVKVRTVDMKRFDAEVRTLLDIFNDAWSDNWGYVPFSEAEIAVAAKTLKPVVIRDLAIFVDVDGESVAFIVALANLNEAIADFNGRLGPLNLLKLLWRLKIAGPESTRVPLMGVKKKYRNHPLMGAGLAMMAIDQLRQNGKRLGKKTAELGWILEDNKATNNIIRSVGGVLYKTHRIYEKALG